MATFSEIRSRAILEYKPEHVQTLRDLVTAARSFQPLDPLQVDALAEACQRLLDAREQAVQFFRDDRVAFFAENEQDLPLAALEWIVQENRGNG